MTNAISSLPQFPQTQTATRDEAPKKIPTAPQGGRTLTPSQLMEKLQVSENTIYWELRHGSLKSVAFRIGRQWRVSEAALESLMVGAG